MSSVIAHFINVNWELEGKLTDISSSGLSGSVIYILETATGKFVLKGYPAKITTDNIQVVHDLLLSLTASDFTKIPQLIKTKTGATTVFANDRSWEVLTFVNGKEEITTDPDSRGIKSIAETLAEFHKLSTKLGNDSRARIPKVVNKSKLLANSLYLQNLDPAKVKLLKDYGYYDLFAEFLGRISEVYTRYLDIDWEGMWPLLPQNFIHSDLTKKNMLFADGEVAALIDFESTKYGARIWDIARVPVEFTDGDKDKVEYFLECYHHVNPLTEIERKFMPNWMHCLNVGVNCWALTDTVDRHLEEMTENSAYLVGRIEKAVRVMHQPKWLA